jgi:DNA-binding CsgD family transcriptional regulator
LLRAERSQEICHALGIRRNTLHKYRSNLIVAFGVESVEQVIAKAFLLGWHDKLKQ